MVKGGLTDVYCLQSAAAGVSFRKWENPDSGNEVYMVQVLVKVGDSCVKLLSA